MATSSHVGLPRTLLEHPILRASTPRERLYLFWLVSEFALNGPFYRSDLEVAVTLATSVTLIRQTRRIFSRLGWIITRPGFQAGGRNLATRYLELPCLRGEAGDPTAPIRRFAFEVLLHRVRGKELRHSDVVVYLYLDYLRVLSGGEDEDAFEITKNHLCELTGLPGAPGAVRRLYRGFHFDDGSSLFTYEDQPDRLILGNWLEFPDPADYEDTAEEAEAMRQSVNEQVKMRRRELLCPTSPTRGEPLRPSARNLGPDGDAPGVRTVGGRSEKAGAEETR